MTELLVVAGKARDGGRRRLHVVDTTFRDFCPSAWQIGNYEPAGWKSSKSAGRPTTTAARVFRRSRPSSAALPAFDSFFGRRSMLRTVWIMRRRN